ncbi:MAG: hypothetical protein ACTSXJ_09645 [Candidatus Baldrarchaeia archaeon]
MSARSRRGVHPSFPVSEDYRRSANITVVRVNHRALERLLIHNYNCGKNAIFIWGGIGIGKSTTVRRTSQKLASLTRREFIDWNRANGCLKKKVIEDPGEYFVFIDIRLSQYDPSDLKGLPDLRSEFVTWRPPMWFYILTLPQSAGILFLDELNHAPPMIQSAAFQLILDRCLGEYSLSDGVMVVAAGNRPEDSTAVFKMSKALENRFLHVELKAPTFEEWEKWALENDIDPRIIAFLRLKPDLLYVENGSGPAYPTPRAWEFASNLIKGVEDPDDVEMYVASAVGFGAAREFREFLRFSQIRIEEILENPEILNESRYRRMDVRAVIAYSLGSYFKMHKTRDVLRKIIRVLRYFNPEFRMVVIKHLKIVDEGMLEEEAMGNPELVRMLELLNEAMEGDGYEG